MQPDFAAQEIRDAEQNLIRLLEDSDVSRRLEAYSDDAVFVLSGDRAIEGRDEMARRAKSRLFDVALTPLSTEGHGPMACVYARFSCVIGRTASDPGNLVALRILMMWRREAEGVWRICREFLVPNVTD